MSEKAPIKISLSTFFLVIALLVIIVMGIYLYIEKTNSDKTITELENSNADMEATIDNLQNKIDSIANTINSDNKTTIANNTSKLYAECEKQCSGVRYRRETGGSSGFFIKDGVLYSGEENMVETQSKTTGITEKVKYVVPLDKQHDTALALTEDGKLYTNENDVLGGTSFKKFLSNFEILEILQLPNEEKFKFLTVDGKIVNMDGTVYLDLL